MPIISSATILRSLALIHITAAYYLITAPSVLPKNNLVGLLSGATALRPPGTSAIPDSFSSANYAASFAGLCLGVWGFSDLLATSLPEFAYDEFWSAQASLRLLLWFLVGGWAYVSKFTRSTGVSIEESLGGHLRNGLVFSFAFVEMVMTFWVFTNLREERAEAAKRYAEKQKKEEELREAGLKK
ncbi:MAG: hypothetical protein M1831_003883 [Alyxoria varia]|nr:MAG: hypothetical protein M1831_003883 [Alyxoria varia]